MMKKFSLILTLVLALALLAGCVGTPVVYTDCTCGSGEALPNQPSEPPVVAEGAVKTGLAIVANAAKSENAAKIEYDVTYVAVNVDENGVIVGCIIDSLGATVTIDGSGAITGDLSAQPKTKNELGADYNMVKFGGAIAEWDAQARALADFAVGKTLEELKSGAIDQTGYAPDGTDLAASATIYLGGYVAAIEKAVANARHVGAQGGDTLKLAVISKLSDSTPAGEKAGNAQLDSDVVALNVRDGVITGCVIDSLQAKVAFDTTGTITSDVSGFATKNELGADYNMVKFGGAIAEWDAQAAAFAAYVTGKTGAEVAGIAVSQGKPAQVDLASSVTIAIGGFQALIAKALQ